MSQLANGYTFSQVPTVADPANPADNTEKAWVRSLSFMNNEWQDAKIVTTDTSGSIGMFGADDGKYYLYLTFEANVDDAWWQINECASYYVSNKRFMLMM